MLKHQTNISWKELKPSIICGTASVAESTPCYSVVSLPIIAANCNGHNIKVITIPCIIF